MLSKYTGVERLFLNLIVSKLILCLVVMLIEYRFLNIKLDMRKWQSEDIGFSFRSRTCLRNMAYLVSFTNILLFHHALHRFIFIFDYLRYLN